MSATYVIDASALIKLVLDEPDSPAFRDWFTAALNARARFTAPSLLPYEIAQTLWRRVPSRARTGSDWTRDVVRDLLLAVELDDHAWARIDPWRDALSAYDAAYLALAVARDATLVTYDRALAAAARAHVQVHRPGT